jgi:hypothetical protein
MAGFAAISAAGMTIVRLLNACFQAEQPVDLQTTRAVLVQSADFRTGANSTGVVPAYALSVFLYRVDFNKTMRAAWSALGSLDGQSHLPVDLHFLLTPWADNAVNEQRILGKAMQCLESTPIVSGPLLYPTTSWAASEGVQFVLEDVGTEAVMRIFDSLEAEFRISVPYIVRVVRVDGTTVNAPPTVTSVVTGRTASAAPAP